MSTPILIASVGDASEAAALELVRKEIPATVDDYSSGGGSMLEQTRRACAAGKPYRMFVFWPTSGDVGDLEACVRLVRDFDLRAQAVLFTTSGLTFGQVQSIRDICTLKTVTMMPAAGKEPSYVSGTIRYSLEKGYGIDHDLIEAGRRDRIMARTNRLHDAKWGVFNHYLGDSRVKTAEEWNAMVDSFDVVRLADQLEACGAPYYFITLMQVKRWMCAPNATFDRIAGTKPGEACSRRDLPAEIAAELAKRGIDLYLYFAGEGPLGDPPYNARFGYTEPFGGAGVTRPFVERWASVMEEYAVRYGGAVKGWWVDSCMRSAHRYTDELLALYARAAWKGNPDAVIAINDGVKPAYERNAPTDDYTAGEFNDFFAVPPSRFIDGAQAHALIPLGAWRGRDPNWGGRGLKRTPEYVADYVSLVNANGGVVTIDVHVDPDGSWDPEQLEALKVVGRRTGTLK